MFRTTAARAVPKSLTTFRTTSTRTPLTKFTQQAAFRTSTRSVKTSPILALAVQQPLRKSLVRYASGGGSQIVYGQDPEAEKNLQSQKIVAVPEEVTTTSTVHKAFQEKGVEQEEQDVDMMAGIRSDFVCLCTAPWSKTEADLDRPPSSILFLLRTSRKEPCTWA